MPRMTIKALCAIAAFVLATLSIGAPARAEIALDLFGGVSLTESTNVAVDGIDNTNASLRGVLSDVKMDPGFTVGLRVGYWFESLPFLGLGVDAFFFTLPIPAQTVDSTVNISGSIRGRPISNTGSGQVRLPSIELPFAGFSPQLMLRWPLFTSNEMPAGRLQPYAGIGPAWAVSIDRDEVVLVPGGLVRGGLAFQVFRHLALFAEYRYSFFPNFELTDSHGLHFQTDVRTHHVVGGLSIRF
jgi:hypothetical protein